MGFVPNQQETQYAQSRAYGPAHWASLEPEAAMAALGSRRAGLNKAEVAERLARYGHNTLPRLRRRPWYLELAANFIHLFALLLWAGAGLAWVAGMPQLAWAIIAVILINGLFSFWQEYQAERAAEALEALLPRQVTVRRDGQPQLVPTSEIAPGDLLLLSEGEATPADARLISAERLRLDVSSLTGESRPIPRTVESIGAAPDAGAATLSNLVFAGTTVASGRGEAVVFATGANTEFGRIAQLTQSQDERPSPLQRELKRVTRFVTILAVGLGIAFFVIGVKLGGLSPASGFLFAIGIIVANVPEGLLPTLTLALALGVKRMARRRALVKRLSAVETLGATTVILTDKTGTLTENEMTARELWAGGANYQLSGTGYEPVGELSHRDGAENDPAAVTEMLRAAALCCDAHLVPPQNDQRRWTAIGDPTEAAILAAAAKLGLSQEKLAAWPRLAELPFDSTRKRMTTIQRIDGDSVACVKGAPGEIFARCVAIRLRGGAAPFDDEWRRRAEAAHDAMARRGLRVLAVATRSVDPNSQANDGWRVEDVERELTLLGLIAMEDPPRPEVPSAIAACRQAGVRVVMVTGDHGLTAAAIGREIGLSDGDARVVTGVELDSLDDGRLAALLDTKDVIFARVTPEHKLRLVEACQRKGEVVAVTGDGVNDAPALKRADIGVAMGITGTDVAREAADMVLADDNFASIVAAIEEGRAVYDNVRKFVTYIFASNIAGACSLYRFRPLSDSAPADGDADSGRGSGNRLAAGAGAGRRSSRTGRDAPSSAFAARAVAQLADVAARLRLARNDRGRSIARRLLLRLLARGLASGRADGRERVSLCDGDDDDAGRHCGLPGRQCLRLPQQPSGELAARFRKQSPAAHRNRSGDSAVAPVGLRAAAAIGVRPGAAGNRALVVARRVRPAAACL